LRRQVTTYISVDTLARLREEAHDAGVTLSRLIEERLAVSDGDSRRSVSQSMLAATEHRIIKTNRSQVEQAIRPLGKQLAMLLAMLDQFALSMLTHMPEIPEGKREQALASGERRHHGWRLEVEETIQQLEAPHANGKKVASGAAAPEIGDHDQHDSAAQNPGEGA